MTTSSETSGQRLDYRAVLSWSFYDWAAQPFFTLITTFIFAPYFASALASSPEEGQTLWAFATATAAILLLPLMVM